MQKVRFPYISPKILQLNLKIYIQHMFSFFRLFYFRPLAEKSFKLFILSAKRKKLQFKQRIRDASKSCQHVAEKVHFSPFSYMLTPAFSVKPGVAS